MAPSRGTLGRAALLASLYVAQGLPFGLFTQALPVMLRQAGTSLEGIGLSNLLALPWALKFLWAPAVDRIPGARARVITPLNLAAAALLVALAFVTPGAIVPLMVVVFGCNLFAASQDIATDALAVELLPDEERGLGNGVQVAGYRLGMVLGGGVLLKLFDAAGWQETFLVAAAAVTVASLPVLVGPSPPRLPPERPEAGRDVLRWDRWFAGPEGLRWFALLFSFKFGESFGGSMVRPMFVDQGLTLGDIGGILGLWGSGAGMAGALLGGLLLNRLGERTALLGFGVLQALTLLAYAALAVAGPAWAVPAVVIEHLFSGMATAALFTVMMRACRPGHAGAEYTVQASVVVLAQGGAGVASGWSAANLGYAGHFLLGVALCTAAVPVVASLPRHRGRFGLGGAG